MDGGTLQNFGPGSRSAEDADVLVHEALYVPAVDRLVARIANAAH
jgi:hypothetical protein